MTDEIRKLEIELAMKLEVMTSTCMMMSSFYRSREELLAKGIFEEEPADDGKTSAT